MNPGTFAVAIGSVLIGLLGLFVASRATDVGIELFGYVLVGFSLLMTFLFIKRYRFD